MSPKCRNRRGRVPHLDVSELDSATVLARIPLFEGLQPSDLAELASRANERKFASGSVIFLEGDPGDVAYIILSGCVEITLSDVDGNQLVLHRALPEGYFGEMALLDGQPRSATATAAEDSVLLTISRQALLAFLKSKPEAALLMLRLTSERLRSADQKIKALGFQTVAGRLAQCILDLAEANREGPISIRHDQLADMVGSRRPTVTTLLNQWQELGYIRTARGRISVVERAGLEELSEI